MKRIVTYLLSLTLSAAVLLAPAAALAACPAASSLGTGGRCGSAAVCELDTGCPAADPSACGPGSCFASGNTADNACSRLGAVNSCGRAAGFGDRSVAGSNNYCAAPEYDWYSLLLELLSNYCSWGDCGSSRLCGLLPGRMFTPAPVAQAAPSTAVTAQTEAALAVAELVNEARLAAGVDELELDPGLSAAAMIRADEIGTVFQHTRPDGSSCFTALDEAQVKYGRAGENIALGQADAATVMNDWLNSPGHRANILDADFTRLGVAALPNGNNGYAWVQLFTD